MRRFLSVVDHQFQVFLYFAIRKRHWSQDTKEWRKRRPLCLTRPSSEKPSKVFLFIFFKESLQRFFYLFFFKESLQRCHFEKFHQESLQRFFYLFFFKEILQRCRFEKSSKLNSNIRLWHGWWWWDINARIQNCHEKVKQNVKIAIKCKTKPK